MTNMVHNILGKLRNAGFESLVTGQTGGCGLGAQFPRRPPSQTLSRAGKKCRTYDRHKIRISALFQQRSIPLLDGNTDKKGRRDTFSDSTLPLLVIGDEHE